MPRPIGMLAAAAVLLIPSSLPALAEEDLLEKEIAATVSFLASPELEGRAAGTRGGEVAAAYVASRLAAAGCLPAGDATASGRSYHQAVPSVEASYDAAGSSLEVPSEKGPMRLRDAAIEPPGFRTIPDRADTVEAKGALLFAGFGIRAPELHHDDYAGVDTKGRIVVVLSGEPGETDAASPWNGTRPTRHLPVSSKRALAASLGASALLVVPNPAGRARTSKDLASPGGAEPSSTYLGLAERTPSIPVAYLDREAADRLLAGVDLAVASAALETGKSASRELPERSATLRLAYRDRRELLLRNVVARVGAGRGLDGEVVLLGAHLDHLGNPGGVLHPGADDNATGVAALLAAAAALRASPPQGGREIVLAAWTGEERGQLGSTFFASHPVVALGRISTVVNLDMLGRNNLDREDFATVLQVIYAAGAPVLRTLAVKANEGIGFDLRFHASLRFRPVSDHAPLFEAGLPIVYPFSGYHDDYHRPTDTPEKVLPPRVARATRFVTRLLRLLALHPDPIRLDPAIREAPAPDPFPTPYGG